ncbi:MAG TPA: WD40 repeat domain-containing protein [Gemmataceae bacterium]|jgi:WD40 repeat protein|nr:WD40 repeat domain-containing protein [Gemmataceae bacterium]
MIAPDRRTFLQATAGLALGAAPVLGTSPPPPSGKTEVALKPAEGKEFLPLPPGASRRLGDPRMRILGHINALQFSPKGTTLVSATSGELRGWDPRTGKVLFRYSYPAESNVDSGRLTSRDTFALLVRPNSSGGYEFRHYEFATGKLLKKSPSVRLEHTQTTAYSVDGTRMAVVQKEALCLHDTATGEEKWRAPLPAEAAGGCQFFEDGSAVAIALRGEILVFATATGKLATTLKTVPSTEKAMQAVGRDVLSNLACSPEGKWISVSVGDDAEEICCWEVASATIKYRLKAAGKSIGFSPDGAELLTCHQGKAMFWATATGKKVREFDVPRDDLLLSPDGKILAARAGDSAILLDSSTGKPLTHSPDPPGVPTTLRFVTQDRLVGRLDEWGGWVQWDLKTGTPLLLRPAGVSGLVPIDLSADGKIGLYRKEGDYSARDMATGKELCATKGADDVNDAVITIAITTDGRSLVGPAADGVAVTNIQGKTTIRRSLESPGIVATTATDGKLAAVAFRANIDRRGFVDIFDLQSAKFVRRVSLDGHPVMLRFSPDGTRLLAALNVDNDGRRGQEGLTIVLDAQSGKQLFRSGGEDNNREQVAAISPDGRVVVRLGNDGQIAIWDAYANQIRATFDVGESATVNAVAVSPDGRTLAASVNGGPVFVWDLFASPSPRWAWIKLDLANAWADLRDGDAMVAYGAIRRLVRVPDCSLPFLKEKVGPLEPPDATVVAKQIADLDHKEFRKREAAAKALIELGERARDPLRQALKGDISQEMRERIDRLLAAEDHLTPEQLRRLRAIEIAERIGSADAAKLLTHWAGGAPGAQFTIEAAAARKRLADLVQ